MTHAHHCTAPFVCQDEKTQSQIHAKHGSGARVVLVEFLTVSGRVLNSLIVTRSHVVVTWKSLAVLSVTSRNRDQVVDELRTESGGRVASTATAGECTTTDRTLHLIETQLRSQLNSAQGLAELLGAITTVLSGAQAPTRRMLIDQKGLGKPPVFSGTCGPRKLRSTCPVSFRTYAGLRRVQWSRKMWSQQQRLRPVCLSLTPKSLQRQTDNSS